MIFTTNIKHPVTFSHVSGSTQTVDEIEAINQSVGLILQTACGEMYGDPEFGTRLYEFIFDLEGSALRYAVIEEICRCLNLYEPRIVVTEKDVTVVENFTDIEVRLKYNIRNTDLVSDYQYIVSRDREVV